MPIDPVAQKMLDDARVSGRPNAHLLPVATARENFEAAFAGLTRPAIARVVDVTIPTRDGDRIRGRVYLPDSEGELPLTVYYHGGGWLMGSIDSHDVTTRLLANAAGSAVLSVDYRRGPEHRFPIAVDDAIDALLWAGDAHTVADLGVDARRLAVAGDSAGGNLACAVAIHARDTDLAPAVRHQLLVYPASTTDLSVGFDDRYQGVMLERDECLWHQSNYLSTPEDHADPRMTLLNADLAGLPEATVILAECDPIKPQGVLLAEALHAAGVPTITREYPGMIHGFFGLDEIFPVATDAMHLAGERLARALQPRIGTPA
ncbi:MULTISPECIES: alpha/beta hydrolase [unclassified Mycolicibacterium]|uniref:alpha/beta hydrolase n=1 Tax=unclassified Mycolicibacterium TaxID=2636767 RepID=UPI0012DCEC8C|nr:MULTISPECIES: alpha/beta hydrolase [unclassified Mycolicibacterium]MUL82348.1 alpha/beta hydrolase fold domain-containing protein [Mycolicibacterium sp. CBMA 329]MUL88114.1 alpha/beta hydrolase fold domain-containing protein [Mycolicibacterium sp. CBMA 331]MUM02444.1 alpha/beta hydrolase fold domain-containing protein [Mycolicibacterium sp. CBMA 334]MUM24846.1 alpha/beta hydrolase fold domain-containing protein [Mycolicibacterium sp. CBMA 295]MUM38411.1 alpha/beta hydrolase fold domain-cont